MLASSCKGNEGTCTGKSLPMANEDVTASTKPYHCESARPVAMFLAPSEAPLIRPEPLISGAAKDMWCGCSAARRGGCEAADPSPVGRASVLEGMTRATSATQPRPPRTPG